MKIPAAEPESAVTNQSANHIYSAGARMFIHDYQQAVASENDTPDSALIEKYSLEKINNKYYVGILARVSEHFNPDALIPLEALTGSNLKGSLSLKIPVGNVEKLGSVKGFEYIDVSRKIKLKNNR